jgi:hypothetical protein
VSETSKVPYMPGKTVDRVIQHLNTLCRPIAQFSPLAQDEVVRLKLAVRDCFRLME